MRLNARVYVVGRVDRILEDGGVVWDLIGVFTSRWLAEHRCKWIFGLVGEKIDIKEYHGANRVSIRSNLAHNGRVPKSERWRYFIGSARLNESGLDGEERADIRKSWVIGKMGEKSARNFDYPVADWPGGPGSYFPYGDFGKLLKLVEGRK